ncbi:hypothetical protein JTE90_019783, partial [Oedothorax gibbosus]
MPNNGGDYWTKTARELCAKKTKVELKNIFTEHVQEVATWWS